MKKINKKNEFENLIEEACESYEINGKIKNISTKKTKNYKNKKVVSKK